MTHANPSRRELMWLAAALAGTTLTAAAAIAGLARHPAAPVQIVSTVQAPQQPAPVVEPQDFGG
ncbi:MAG TPA: hypothetical protein VI408_01450 [Gaiellaceae bacterium]